ncbi:MAG: GNAT family protein [Catalinimonas sp.]
MLITSRLQLIPTTVEHWHAEREDIDVLADLLDATVTTAWPPADRTSVRDDWSKAYEGAEEEPIWLAWYGVLRKPEPTVVAHAGFDGAPNAAGEVAVRYALLPDHASTDLAVELLDALTFWALSQPNVNRVLLAESVEANADVLSAVGFAWEEATSRHVLAVTTP